MLLPRVIIDLMYFKWTTISIISQRQILNTLFYFDIIYSGLVSIISSMLTLSTVFMRVWHDYLTCFVLQPITVVLRSSVKKPTVVIVLMQKPTTFISLTIFSLTKLNGHGNLSPVVVPIGTSFAIFIKVLFYMFGSRGVIKRNFYHLKENYCDVTMVLSCKIWIA